MELSGKTILGSIAAIAIALAVGYWLGSSTPAPEAEPELPQFRLTGPVEYVEDSATAGRISHEIVEAKGEAFTADSKPIAAKEAQVTAEPAESQDKHTPEP